MSYRVTHTCTSSAGTHTVVGTGTGSSGTSGGAVRRGLGVGVLVGSGALVRLGSTVGTLDGTGVGDVSPRRGVGVGVGVGVFSGFLVGL